MTMKELQRIAVFRCSYLYMELSAGLRPFGVSILYMGWDKHYGYQLYQSDPSGNYSGWKATCIGNNSVVSLQGGDHCLVILTVIPLQVQICVLGGD